MSTTEDPQTSAGDQSTVPSYPFLDDTAQSLIRRQGYPPTGSYPSAPVVYVCPCCQNFSPGQDRDGGLSQEERDRRRQQQLSALDERTRNRGFVPGSMNDGANSNNSRDGPLPPSNVADLLGALQNGDGFPEGKSNEEKALIVTVHNGNSIAALPSHQVSIILRTGAYEGQTASVLRGKQSQCTWEELFEFPLDKDVSPLQILAMDGNRLIGGVHVPTALLKNEKRGIREIVPIRPSNDMVNGLNQKIGGKQLGNLTVSWRVDDGSESKGPLAILPYPISCELAVESVIQYGTDGSPLCEDGIRCVLRDAADNCSQGVTMPYEQRVQLTLPDGTEVDDAPQFIPEIEGDAMNLDTTKRHGHVLVCVPSANNTEGDEEELAVVGAIPLDFARLPRNGSTTMLVESKTEEGKLWGEAHVTWKVAPLDANENEPWRNTGILTIVVVRGIELRDDKGRPLQSAQVTAGAGGLEGSTVEAFSERRNGPCNVVWNQEIRFVEMDENANVIDITVLENGQPVSIGECLMKNDEGYELVPVHGLDDETKEDGQVLIRYNYTPHTKESWEELHEENKHRNSRSGSALDDRGSRKSTSRSGARAGEEEGERGADAPDADHNEFEEEDGEPGKKGKKSKKVKKVKKGKKTARARAGEEDDGEEDGLHGDQEEEPLKSKSRSGARADEEDDGEEDGLHGDQEEGPLKSKSRSGVRADEEDDGEEDGLHGDQEEGPRKSKSRSGARADEEDDGEEDGLHGDQEEGPRKSKSRSGARADEEDDGEEDGLHGDQEEEPLKSKSRSGARADEEDDGEEDGLHGDQEEGPLKSKSRSGVRADEEDDGEEDGLHGDQEEGPRKSKSRSGARAGEEEGERGADAPDADHNKFEEEEGEPDKKGKKSKKVKKGKKGKNARACAGEEDDGEEDGLHGDQEEGPRKSKSRSGARADEEDDGEEDGLHDVHTHDDVEQDEHEGEPGKKGSKGKKGKKTPGARAGEEDEGDEEDEPGKKGKKGKKGPAATRKADETGHDGEYQPEEADEADLHGNEEDAADRNDLRGHDQGDNDYDDDRDNEDEDPHKKGPKKQLKSANKNHPSESPSKARMPEKSKATKKPLAKGTKTAVPSSVKPNSPRGEHSAPAARRNDPASRTAQPQRGGTGRSGTSPAAPGRSVSANRPNRDQSNSRGSPAANKVHPHPSAGKADGDASAARRNPDHPTRPSHSANPSSASRQRPSTANYDNYIDEAMNRYSASRKPSSSASTPLDVRQGAGRGFTPSSIPPWYPSGKGTDQSRLPIETRRYTQEQDGNIITLGRQVEKAHDDLNRCVSEPPMTPNASAARDASRRYFSPSKEHRGDSEDAEY